MRALVLLLLAGCLESPDSAKGLTARARFTISETSGQGPSHLDVLADQDVDLSIFFLTPVETFPVVGGCPTIEWTQPDAQASAGGSAPTSVQTELIAYLPEWTIRLSLCDDVAQSSVQLSADNFTNTGFTIGCIGLPSSALLRDDKQRPLWSDFTAPRCTMTVLDADTNRVLGASNFALAISLLASEAD